jgi:hypothetical protein
LESFDEEGRGNQGTSFHF